jgi:DNA primase
MGSANLPPIWKCFSCGKQGVGHPGAAIRWLIEYHGLSYADALQQLQITQPVSTATRQAPPIQHPDNPPCQLWQARALHLIERAESVLWSERGKNMLAWLQARGLNDDTIRAARLGYIPKDFSDKPTAWGTPNDDPRPVHLFQGLLIPGVIASKVWYLKMRPDHRRGDIPKYICVRGSKATALYGADHIAKDQPAVFCEGELDALLLRQEIKDLASVMTLGSASNEINLATWGLYLLRPSCFILAYDIDHAGAKGGDKLAWLHDAQRLNIPALMDGDKDLTDFHKSGGNLYSLIENVLRPDAPIFVNWQVDTKPATIRDQYWRNPDNRIEAFYLPDQLAACLDTMQTH